MLELRVEKEKKIKKNGKIYKQIYEKCVLPLYWLNKLLEKKWYKYLSEGPI